jgi:dihydrofolate reductase
MQICLIWAQDRKGAIGKDNLLPWRLPEDLRKFKELTSGHLVVMGRNTWESLPRKPLPGRTNLVLTSSPKAVSSAGALPVASLKAAVELASALRPNRLFMIGGGRVYQEALAIADLVYLTRVETEVADADAWAPVLPCQWNLVSSSGPLTSETGLRYCFETWAKVRPRH